MLKLEVKYKVELAEFEQERICIVEIFKSISGEGISAGEVVSFVRVAGCNLRCSYCDTKYSYKQSGSHKLLKVNQILDILADLECKSLICTGGEPLETNSAKRYLPLYLASKGFKLRIESNGSCPVYSKMEKEKFLLNKNSVVNYTLDVKLPSSKMSNYDLGEYNFCKLDIGDELKFVVGKEDDFNYSLEVIDKFKKVLANNKVIINFSPVFEKISPERIVKFLKKNDSYFKKNNLKTRLSLQIHKLIWSPNKKGV